MAEIEFKVSAKAARLIGRENISDVDGALIELIKNAYDADASCVFIKFSMPFPTVPYSTSITSIKKYMSDTELKEVLSFYDIGDEKVIQRKDISDSDKEFLKKAFFSKNKIIVADNGIGMPKSVIETSWMQIGTSDKEINIYSDKGRIKTGAKGIGRFALDKLSLQSQVYTKNVSDNLIFWAIDWEQFSKTKLLNQIHAEISPIHSSSYREKVELFTGEDFQQVKDYCWDTGTMIILSPTRDAWPERYFKKTNNNLQSIIPLTSEDKFDVIIFNQLLSEYNFSTMNRTNGIVDYDFKIVGEFNGNKELFFTIYRNEIDINKDTVELQVSDEVSEVVSLDSFWSREMLKSQNYSREDFGKNIDQSIQLDKIIKDEEVEVLNKLGKFSFDFYFMKNSNSEIEILKTIKNIGKRKEFLKNFKGVKIYRDDFKVRPYGDEGQLFDWIGLGVRSQKSPASVTHPNGSWRVEPYQVLGSVNLGRLTNPLLTDMANREGLAQNSEYALLVKIIDKVFERFEYDRQYVLREYGKWKKQKIEELSPSKNIVDSLIENVKEQNDRNSVNSKDLNWESKDYSKKDYEEAILSLVKNDDNALKTNQILMAFSSAGVMTNTFSHEISRISTDVGSRIQHLRESVKRVLNYGEFSGDQDFNPFTLMKESEETDELLNSWIKIIMDAVNTNNFEKTLHNVVDMVNKIVLIWTPLMEKKYISFKTTNTKDNIFLNIAEMDLHLILNNFFLNSAWFLEDSKNKNRLIFVDVLDAETAVEFHLKNNGPILDATYKNNPNIIFNAGETSKTTGTGLGLWIVREVVNRYGGEVNAIDVDDGFEIKIIFYK
ncbi:MAG: ATP-binding protein [Oscillospiraceae bacterium]